MRGKGRRWWLARHVGLPLPRSHGPEESPDNTPRPSGLLGEGTPRRKGVTPRPRCSTRIGIAQNVSLALASRSGVPRSRAAKLISGTSSSTLAAAMRTSVRMTSQPHAQARFRRAIERRALWLAEDAARELPNLSLQDALQLVHLYGDRESPKFEPAARRWLVRYLTEGTPSLKDIAKVTASLANVRPS